MLNAAEIGPVTITELIYDCKDEDQNADAVSKDKMVLIPLMVAFRRSTKMTHATTIHSMV